MNKNPESNPVAAEEVLTSDAERNKKVFVEEAPEEFTLKVVKPFGCRWFE